MQYKKLCGQSYAGALKCFVLWVMIATIIGCNFEKGNYRLVAIDASKSGIDFVNRITENDSVNVVDFQYCYNGGGVGIGDFDANGLPDIVFTGNQVSSALYLNKGNFQFKDVSEVAKLSTTSWVTGVSIIDINADGLDDIYLNVGGADCQKNCPNQLFVNQGLNADGIPTFEEKARDYGLDDSDYSQQSVFFDYDGDGDLDVFILHNGSHGFAKNNPLPKRYMAPHLNDRLLRNDSVPGLGHPHFKDVSHSAGIVHGGFGLGVGINDINGDGLIDIYVANDFITEDLLYVQQRHPDSIAPWFIERHKKSIGHASYNAMGIDFADANNDGLADILVVDMMPENYERQKKMLGSMNYERYLLALRNGYGSQYVRNTLQLNNGSLDSIGLKMSEVGFISGIASTDWSWAPLLLDLDNDGDKDLYISNGYVKDVTDLDYINYSGDSNLFGTTNERRKKQKDFAGELDSIYIPNYIYENKEGPVFEDVSDQWALATPTYSNGAAYADFDLDGDLDIVLNNTNGPATLLKNTNHRNVENQYLRVRLSGTRNNPNGIGAKLTIWQNGQMQQQFQSVVRGYLSSVEPILHFGLGDVILDSLLLQWPNGQSRKYYDIDANQVLELTVRDADSTSLKIEQERISRDFTKFSDLVPYVHEENDFNEYAVQPLLMRQYSKAGPCMASADIDGNAGDELFIGGSKGHAGAIWFQDAQGRYLPKQQLDTIYEDTDAAFVDIDGDGDLDLYVTSGGSEFDQFSEFYNDRIYVNDGSGQFERDEMLLSSTDNSTQVVRSADIDNDGDTDLFIGAETSPWRYPNVPVSRIMINTNGRFSEMVHSGIDTVGMVSDALWEDIDGDGRQDLIVVGEWMPIKAFRNLENKFEPMNLEWTDENGQPVSTNGWWRCIEKSDVDQDGDIDFLIGNQGLNGVLNPSQAEPIYLYQGDFDSNGSCDPVLATFYGPKHARRLLPLHSRDDIVAQLPTLKKKYLRYDDFNKVDFKKLLGIDNLDAETLSASTFANSYAENLGNGKFRLRSLPYACQLAPINDFIIFEEAAGVYSTYLAVGNDFTSESIYGRADAFTGLTFRFKNGSFVIDHSSRSGFYVPGQGAKLLKITDTSNREWLLAAQNQDSLLVFAKAQKD